jgi:hypothetical protein
MVDDGDDGNLSIFVVVFVWCCCSIQKMRGNLGGETPPGARAPRILLDGDGRTAPAILLALFFKNPQGSCLFGDHLQTDGVEMIAKLSIQKAAHAIATDCHELPPKQQTTTMTAAMNRP